MKIETKTPDRLVVKNHNWALNLIVTLIGIPPLYAGLTGAEAEGMLLRVFLVAMGLGIAALAWKMIPMITLTFDRPAGSLEVRHRRITGTKSYLMSLEAIEGAMYQSTWNDGTRAERLALRTNEGPLPMEFGYGGAGRPEIAKEIDAWLKGAG